MKSGGMAKDYGRLGARPLPNCEVYAIDGDLAFKGLSSHLLSLPLSGWSAAQELADGSERFDMVAKDFQHDEHGHCQ